MKIHGKYFSKLEIYFRFSKLFGEPASIKEFQDFGKLG